METVTLPVKGLNFAGCACEIEKNLGKLTPIALVAASYVSQTVTITYDETRLSEVQLREMVKDCGFACGEPLTRFTAPIATVSQQAEVARAHRTMGQPAMEHRAPGEAPAKMDMGLVDHSMMGHGMSDPAMARAMEADMRNRFFVLLVLTAIAVSFQERSFLRPWWVLLLEGLAGILFGILAFTWPGETALVLLYLMAAWALVTGVMEIGSAFVVPGTAGQRWGVGLAGLLSLIFGIILIVHPGAGLLAILWLVGIYAIVFGVSLIMYAFQVRLRTSTL